MQTAETKAIKTVHELIQVLKEKPENRSYLEIMADMEIPFSEFEKYFTWNQDHYTRNCLTKTDEFELLLICWEEGQHSTIHDFDSNESWIHTIHGKLKEERFMVGHDQLEKVSSMIIDPDCFSYMTDPISIHRYINIYESRTVTLNLYAKPVEEWCEYNEETGEYKKVKTTYDSMYEFDSSGNANRIL